MTALASLCLLSAAAHTQESRLPVLEEVQVTAQRRQQDMQDVGITMSAFSQEEIRAATLLNLSDLPALVSNVQLFQDYGGRGLPTWVIRGVGLQDFNANNTPTAAVYIDEVYQSSTAMGAVGLFDIERVEVLKGPQGGLYGRNTSGGAINVITRSPQLDQQEGYLNLQLGRWQSSILEGAFNLPVGDALAFRFAGRYQGSGDAWQRSLASGETHGEADRLDLRWGMLYSGGDFFDLDVRVHGGRDDSEITLGRSIGLYNASGGLCEPVLAGYRDDANCLNWAGVNRITAGGEPESPGIQSDDGSLVLSDALNRHAHDYHGARAIAGFHFPYFHLHSITAFDRFDYGVELDLDASRGEYGHRPSSSDMQGWSQEFRLSSLDTSPLLWLVGASFSRDAFDEDRQFLLGDNIRIGLVRGDLSYRQFTRSAALFGQVEYRFDDQWSLLGNMRYTDERKRYREGNFVAPALPPPVNVFARNLASDYELGSRVSGKLQLSWQPGDDLLYYASVSRGFKAGGFYGGFPFNPAEVSPYKEETIIAYEVGVKSAHLAEALRLNVAAFHYDYRDVQGFITRQNPVTGSSIDLLATQGDARHSGIEVEAEWLGPRGFFLRGSLAFLDARLKGSGALTTNLLDEIVPLEGRRPYAPDWNLVFLGGHRIDLTDDWSLLSVLNYHYRSEFSGHLGTPAEVAVQELPGYGVANLRMDLESDTAGWSLGFWIRNLFDETYVTRVKNDGLASFMEIFGEPRSWGFEFQYDW